MELVFWRNRQVTGGREVGDEALLGEEASLREAVHTLRDFEWNLVMVDEGMEAILVNDYSGIIVTGMRMYSERSSGVIQ